MDESGQSQTTTDQEHESENQSKKRRILSKNDVARELVGFMRSARERSDEDELFLLSLAPALKRIDHAKKLQCKMAIMKVINEYGTEMTREQQVCYQPGWHSGWQEGCQSDWNRYGGHQWSQQAATPSAVPSASAEALPLDRLPDYVQL